MTTFSTFGYETVELLREQNVREAFLNIAANLALGLPAVWLGWFFTKMKSPSRSVGIIDPDGMRNGSAINERNMSTTSNTGKKERE